MNLRSVGPGRGFAVLSALLFTVGVQCGPVSAVPGLVTVSAVVQRHASIRVTAPASITVSEEDIARGYVDIAAPVDVTVQSNAPQGYALAFERQGDQVRQAHVQGPGGALLAAAGAAIAVRPAPGRGLWRERVQWRLRFDLARGARAGQHPWPLRISMLPD